MSMHDDIRIQAIAVCATAALERPRIAVSQEDLGESQVGLLENKHYGQWHKVKSYLPFWKFLLCHFTFTEDLP